MQLLKREFTDLEDMRLLYRGNKILEDLFSSSTHSIRQISKDESSAKGFYRFLSNDRISEEDIVSNIQTNCEAACRGKYVLCIQDTTEINLSSHTNRIKKNNDIGTTNVKGEYGLGFMLHPSLVVDAADCIPYGYSDIKIWNRPLELKTKHEREYNKLPIEEKESYKWLEVSKNTKAALKDSVEGMVIVQDREGDIYEQFATIPDEKTDLLIRARTNRKLKDDTKLFTCFVDKPSQGRYEIEVKACKQKKRAKRTAIMEVRYRPITIKKTDATSKGVTKEVDLYLVEANEVGYEGRDKICWRLLTTIEVKNIELAMLCINWYSWRWTVEEVFKILKKEGYNIEPSELEYASSIRKLCVMIMEVTIKLFLMRLAYSEPELDINASTCFTDEEQEYMEHQIKAVEGKTQKQKNPHTEKDLKRYVWLIARLGGWKGYESKRRPGITTLWTGIKNFKMGIEGWHIHRNVSTR
jgi:Transposase DNA-binding